MNSADIITVAELHPTRTLCIIGNGFDLIHGVPSSYRGFRDALPRRSELRQALEMYIRKDDIWGNFEDSLAYLDRETMMSSLDDCMAIMGVLDANDEDFSAADFFAALEMTVAPAQTITRELPNRFRQWVLTLKPTANTLPLKQLLHPEMNYINFNYTEFLEALYEIPKGNILYIHGDRRNKQDSLILGHGHDLDEIFDEWYEANKGRDKFRPMKRGRKGRLYRNDDPTYLAYFLADETKGNWRSQTRYDAIETVARYIEDYYEASAKKTEEVLQRNAMYFQSLQSIKTVLVIGHSLSTVDEPYFKEIIRWNQHCKSLQWIISWYSDVDLQRIDKFARKMGIAAESIRCFRI